jgi:hypothetical protein
MDRSAKILSLCFVGAVVFEILTLVGDALRGLTASGSPWALQRVDRIGPYGISLVAWNVHFDCA